MSKNILTLAFSHKINDILSLLSVDPHTGLTNEQVKENQEKFGKNSIVHKKSVSQFVIFLQQFNQPLVYILLLAGIITAILGEWVDSSVILGVVLVNAIIGYVQESKAIKAIESLSKSVESFATVIRDNQRQVISASEVTIGDIVLLQSGDKIPADVRLFEVKELQVEESALTGESVPVQKSTNPIDENSVLGERLNLGFSGTYVTYGIGKAVVVAIGNDTEIGKINTMISEADILQTPLTKQIQQFSAYLLYGILGLAAITLVVGLIRGESLVDMFMAAVALSVGAIPEGLPAAVTITLAIGVSKMAKRNAIVRKLPAVETLGSVTVICSDKTGTLTQNQMTVEKIFSAKSEYNVTGSGYAPNGEIQQIDTSAVTISESISLQNTLIAGSLCSTARVFLKDGMWVVEGDPTEGALLVSAKKAGLDIDTLIEDYPLLDSVPFESEYQYMATLHKNKKENTNIIFIKGSVESIVDRCSYAASIHDEAIDPTEQLLYNKANEYALEGLRVLAFAMKIVPSEKQSISHSDLVDDLVFLGLQAMIDPPREEVIESVAICQRAGITVKMITGDHVMTAVSIAHKLGIVDSIADDSVVLNGKEISKLSDEELVQVVEKISVFARVSPEDKLRLVKAIQQNNNVVAMTGDGVNDAPSLRQANIGIAMGLSGTDLAKETADMLLTDDNFSTIQAAVEEGRGVYDNLIKFIAWTLPTNFGEGLVLLFAIILGVTLPILPVQILWINMTTAVLMGLMLAFEPKEPGVMDRKPRDPKQPILTNQLIARIITVSMMLCIASFIYFFVAIQLGRSIEEARTLAVNIFVMGELFYLFNCRSLDVSMFKLGLFTNIPLWIGVGAMTILQLMFTYLPWMNRAFQSAPIDAIDWLIITGIGAVIYFVIEIEKKIRYKN
jgi:cation-transporting ATPase F